MQRDVCRVWVTAFDESGRSILGGADKVFVQTWACDLFHDDHYWSTRAPIGRVTTPPWMLHHDQWGAHWYVTAPLGGIARRLPEGLYAVRQLRFDSPCLLNDAIRCQLLLGWLEKALESFSNPPVDEALLHLTKLNLERLPSGPFAWSDMCELTAHIAGIYMGLAAPETSSAHADPISMLRLSPTSRHPLARATVEILLDLIPPHTIPPREIALRIAALHSAAIGSPPGEPYRSILPQYFLEYASYGAIPRPGHVPFPLSTAGNLPNPEAFDAPSIASVIEPTDPPAPPKADDLDSASWFEKLFGRLINGKKEDAPADTSESAPAPEAPPSGTRRSPASKPDENPPSAPAPDAPNTGAQLRPEDEDDAEHQADN